MSSSRMVVRAGRRDDDDDDGVRSCEGTREVWGLVGRRGTRPTDCLVLDVLRYDRGVTAMILLIPNANENELVRSIYLSS